MFLNVNLRLIFSTLPMLPSHVSSPCLLITFQLHKAHYKFRIVLYCIVKVLCCSIFPSISHRTTFRVIQVTVSRPTWQWLTTPMTPTMWNRTVARGRSLEGWGDVAVVSWTHWLRSAALTADLGRRIPAFVVSRSAPPHKGLRMFIVLFTAFLIPWIGHNMNCPQFNSFNCVHSLDLKSCRALCVYMYLVLLAQLFFLFFLLSVFCILLRIKVRYIFIAFVRLTWPVIGSGRLMFLGCLSGHLSICALSVCSLLMSFLCDIMSAYLMDKFQWNLSDIHHLSAHCWQSFQGQRSKVKIIVLILPCNRGELAVLPLPGQRCGTVCSNSIGNWTSPSDSSNDRWKHLCLVCWALAPCVWTLMAPTRNLLTYLLILLLSSQFN